MLVAAEHSHGVLAGEGGDPNVISRHRLSSWQHLVERTPSPSTRPLLRFQQRDEASRAAQGTAPPRRCQSDSAIVSSIRRTGSSLSPPSATSHTARGFPIAPRLQLGIAVGCSARNRNAPSSSSTARTRIWLQLCRFATNDWPRLPPSRFRSPLIWSP